MTKKKPSRLSEALLETADGMLRIGILDGAEHEKITKRLLGRIAPPKPWLASAGIFPAGCGLFWWWLAASPPIRRLAGP